MNEIRLVLIFIAVSLLLLYATFSVCIAKTKLSYEVAFWELWNTIGWLSVNPGLVLADKSPDDKAVLLQLDSKLKKSVFIMAALVVAINIVMNMLMS